MPRTKKSASPKKTSAGKKSPSTKVGSKVQALEAYRKKLASHISKHGGSRAAAIEALRGGPKERKIRVNCERSESKKYKRLDKEFYFRRSKLRDGTRVIKLMVAVKNSDKKGKGDNSHIELAKSLQKEKGISYKEALIQAAKLKGTRKPSSRRSSRRSSGRKSMKK